MNHILFRNFTFLLLFCVLLSCGDKDSDMLPVEFKIGKTELALPPEQSQEVIHAEASSKPVATSSASWLSVSEVKSYGESVRIWAIHVMADANTSSDERMATVTVEVGNQRIDVTVRQQAAKTDTPVEADDPDTSDYELPPINYPTDDVIGETAFQTAKNIFAGWNIGNSLEVPDGETAWGNPLVTKELIEGIKAAGFNAIRIPCAWHFHLLADAEPFTIDPEWMKRVHEVVDYAYKNGMYVIVNTHWDGGWLELHANENDCEAVSKKEKAIWTQIANEFADYGQRLIFAGNNEVRNKVDDNENWGVPSAGERAALEMYNQVFVDAVRATGGKNAQRNLVIQSWCCNPWYALEHLSMPNDVTESHLMVEVHFYDPMDFTHTDKKLQSWGYRKGYYTADNNNQEDYIDNLFGLLKTNFVDKGYPVLLGEYGTVCHSVNNKEIKKSDLYYLEYVTKAAKDNGLVPFYWDNGQPQVGTFGIVNRNLGSVMVPHMLNGIMKGACSGNYPY